jgi:uncharacterized protein YoxC
MSAGEIAGLIAAVAFVLLVGAVAVPLLKLGKVLDETTKLVAGVTDETLPLLREVTTTVTSTNAQLGRADVITMNVQRVTTNVAALTGLFAATLGGPIVRVAAFSYGVRRAVTGRNRKDIERRVRAEQRTEKKAARPTRRTRRRRGVVQK